EGCWLCGQDFRREIDALTNEPLENVEITALNVFEEEIKSKLAKDNKLRITLESLRKIYLKMVPSDFAEKVKMIPWESEDDEIEFVREMMDMSSDLREECISTILANLDNQKIIDISDEQ
ncbi:MAG: hypothetical protein JW891_12025, partial [Candidatus Lokiarchaeota archaeon]|nr:hypothetical protein [Candidatus Lokiarchaeota archaeon]